MRRMIPLQVRLRCPARNSPQESQAMLKKQNVVATLRRDVSFLWRAVIAAMFVGFVGLAVTAALLDLLAIRH